MISDDDRARAVYGFDQLGKMLMGEKVEDPLPQNKVLYNAIRSFLEYEGYSDDEISDVGEVFRILPLLFPDCYAYANDVVKMIGEMGKSDRISHAIIFILDVIGGTDPLRTAYFMSVLSMLSGEDP